MRLRRENSLMYSSKGPFWAVEKNWSRLSSSAPNGPNDSSSAVFKDVQSANFLPDSEQEITRVRRSLPNKRQRSFGGLPLQFCLPRRPSSTAIDAFPYNGPGTSNGARPAGRDRDSHVE